MRSAVLLAALAVGTCAKVIEKEVYVTEWTTTTVTTTVTQWPTHATVAHTKQGPAANNEPADPPLPTVDLSKKATVLPDPALPAPTAGGDAQGAPVATTWYVTSTWEEPAKPATTSLETRATATAPTTTAKAANSYQESLLYNHNIHRSKHTANSLAWSQDLADKARTLAMRCKYEHDTSIGGGAQYGQNIGYGVDAAQVGEDIISKMMYKDEEPHFQNLYGQATPDMSNFDAWGHFTQIVWKQTKEVGCFTYTCPDLANTGAKNSPFTVCNYMPAGNYAGEYADNVVRPN
ncbi:uncharacterized protein N7515_004920 [Penicillium bovifimosum]|uniref:SCP domain-containing protein n=1 Tax=Penicillium bovifimosum TaxID=126998 RepID=A0A9W9H134_9EURO|nr:uncharacterized protein N7515_004920 [Penicillium bovifimosum]KAJ5135642.1 hypothetical protein N7515_004920 [Penicillium bovifimosum]